MLKVRSPTQDRLSYRKLADTQGSLKKSKTKMATEPSMTQSIMQAAIEAVKAEIMELGEAHNPVNNHRPIYPIPRSGCPTLRHPMFD